MLFSPHICFYYTYEREKCCMYEPYLRPMLGWGAGEGVGRTTTSAAVRLCCRQPQQRRRHHLSVRGTEVTLLSEHVTHTHDAQEAPCPIKPDAQGRQMHHSLSTHIKPTWPDPAAVWTDLPAQHLIGRHCAMIGLYMYGCRSD